MKPETVSIIRNLAREATIFALLGTVVATIGIFVFMDNEDRTNAKQKAAEAIHADVKWFPQPKPTPTAPQTALVVLLPSMEMPLVSVC